VCNSCGSHITLSTEMLSHTCPFCGSNAVVQTRAPQDALRPRFLVPFATTTEDCRQQTAVWLQNSWMLPKDLQNLARSTEYTPIYIPFWTFDARTKASWRAEVHNTDARRRRHSAPNWKWERPFLLKLGDREEKVWDWESGAVSVFTDDMLVNGSSQLSVTLLGQMGGYQLSKLVPYDPTFLAGISAQAYEVDLETAWERARRLMRARTKEACQKQASASTMRNFSMNLDFSEESWRYILLPLYLATYRYGDKLFQVMVNGQTGTIAGQRPVDWKRVGWTLAGAFLPGLLLGIVAAVLLANDYGIGAAIGLVAGLALLAWLIFVIDTLRKAGKMATV
jgi:DNA-directed RNA polymerase subunit RPC12/RpoP